MWLLKSRIQVYKKGGRNNFKLGVVSPLANKTLKAENLRLSSKHIHVCFSMSSEECC